MLAGRVGREPQTHDLGPDTSPVPENAQLTRLGVLGAEIEPHRLGAAKPTGVEHTDERSVALTDGAAIQADANERMELR